MVDSGKVQQNPDGEKNPSGFLDSKKNEHREIRGGEKRYRHLFDSRENEQREIRGGEERYQHLFDSRENEHREIRGGEEKHQHLFDSYTETSLKYYPERCINCKRCTQVCPHAVFAEGKDHVELARASSCMECGACALNCPVQAITVQSGVGCAWAMINAALRGRNMDTECSCGGDDGSCCGPSQEPSCGSEDT